jgi:hypothetical protein
MSQAMETEHKEKGWEDVDWILGLRMGHVTGLYDYGSKCICSTKCGELLD